MCFFNCSLFFFFFFFFFFTSCREKGSDIADGSENAYSHYNYESVTNCASTSTGVKFYLSVPDVMLDCLQTDTCPVSELYVSSLDGTDFPFCGGFTFACETLV
jgi:hypothetical protein